MSLTGDKTLLLKSVITGVLISSAFIAIFMCIICAVLLFSSSLPYEYLEYIMIAADGISVFFGAMIAARIAKSGGLLTGLFTGVTVFIALLIIGFGSGTDSVSMLTLIRAAVIIILGILGGIKGVNHKERIHIK